MQQQINKWYVIIFLFILVLNFLFSGLYYSKFNQDITARDQSAYLNLGLNIKNGYGYVTLGKNNGIYPEANIHPIFPYLLSCYFPKSFEQAKIFNLIISTFILIILFFLSQKLFGDLVAILSIFLLSFNSCFQSEAIFVSCEPLLLLFTFLSCYYIFTGFKDEKNWLLAGFYTGLAYLTKGTGILILLSFILFGIITKLFKKQFFYYFILIFLITASPLIIRNIIVFKEPFYNINTKYVMWTDSWTEFLNLQKQGQHLPTIVDYFKTHSLKQAFLREIQGISIMVNVFIASFRLIFIEPFTSTIKVNVLLSFFRTLVNLFLFILFVFGILKLNNKQEKTFFIILFSLFFFSFAWYYKIFYALRFIFPLIPFLYFYGIRYITLKYDFNQPKSLNLMILILTSFTFYRLVMLITKF